jgi:hypothetical protein
MTDMTSAIAHDTPLIPLEQDLAFVEDVALFEAEALSIQELLARAVASEAAAASPRAHTASAAGARRRRQRFAHQAQVYRRLAGQRRV